MIKSDIKTGQVEIEGTGAELVAELTLLMRHIYKAVEERTDETFAKKELDKAYKRAFMSEEKLKEELDAQKAKREAIKKLLKELEENI